MKRPETPRTPKTSPASSAIVSPSLLIQRREARLDRQDLSRISLSRRCKEQTADNLCVILGVRLSLALEKATRQFCSTFSDIAIAQPPGPPVVTEAREATSNWAVMCLVGWLVASATYGCGGFTPIHIASWSFSGPIVTCIGPDELPTHSKPQTQVVNRDG